MTLITGVDKTGPFKSQKTWSALCRRNIQPVVAKRKIIFFILGFFLVI
jgi:hypothetical protein